MTEGPAAERADDSRVAEEAKALVERILEGDRRALARSISLVEDGGARAAELIKRAYPETGSAPIIGITGPSGAGKSTLADRLVSAYRERDLTVAILAVDPTSPFSGGALLGDRVRMQRHAGDPGVFMRSMATRGALGGLATGAYDALTLLGAAGFERLVIETVGVGQDEVDVAGVADTTCVVLTPGAGDEIQAIKAGILEVADLFVLNKADLEGADRAEAQLRAWVTRASEEGWSPPILRTVATESSGIEELVEAIDEHRGWLEASGSASGKRRALARLRLHGLLRDRLLHLAREGGFDAAREEEMVARIAAGEIDPHSAADRVVAVVLGSESSDV